MQAIQEENSAFNLKLVPWTGVAVELGSNVSKTSRAFCFLPLPQKTGLS
jgi:hypothetical protein